MTSDEMSESNAPEAASPDSFVALIPCPWLLKDAEELDEVHAQFWQEEVSFTLEALPEDAYALGKGHVALSQAQRASLWVEPPMPEIAELVDISPIPYTATEVLMLQQHQSLWRVTLEGGPKQGRRAARQMAQLFGTFIDAGACGIFLPGLVRLHSPSFIKKETMDLTSPQALTNLFVNAWHEDGWMRTRGLTSFGLPELEAPVTRGLNAAYFDLMDVAANMIFQGAPFPTGSQLQIGRGMYTLSAGPSGPEDDEAPINGTFGVLTLRAGHSD